MKYLGFLFFVLIASSCCNTKQIVAESSKGKEVIVKVSEPIILEAETEVSNTEKESISDETTINENTKKVEEPIIEHDTTIESFNYSSYNALLKKHVSKEGLVNYKAFKTDRKQLTTYISLLSKNLPNNIWTKEEKLAYWINAYNALTIDLILRNYPVKSIKDINKPWEQRLWKLGDTWYNLEDIEHTILRKMNEPRIHFAIVCASYSCPKLQNEAYSASNLELQLTKVTKDFLSDNKRNTITENHLKLSKIFQWFSKDFKQSGSLIDFLNKYSAIKISNKAKINFNVYNWNLNE